ARPLLGGALLGRDLRPLLARFGEADGDGLIAALHPPAAPALAAAQRALLPPAHRAFHALARLLSIAPRLLFGRHHRLPVRVESVPRDHSTISLRRRECNRILELGTRRREGTKSRR